MDFQFTPDEIKNRRIGVCRASYLAGEVGVDTAVNDLVEEGITPRERAAALLARPMSPERVYNYIAQTVTTEQIDAQVAKVTA